MKHETLAHQEKVGREVCLGKAEPKEDTRTLQLENYIQPKKLLPKVTTNVGWSKVLKPKKNPMPMYANDTLPDCTCAAVGHGERVLSYNAGTPVDPTEEAVLKIFDATGPRNDGRYCIDILNYWRQEGGASGEKILAYVQVPSRNREMFEIACWLFGGLYSGFALPVSAQRQTRWTVVRGPDGEPGSWGGHCIWEPDFTKMRGPTCITWGEMMPMSWGFQSAYCDERYAVLSPAWADGTRKAPSGFDVKTLLDDLQQITK